jgi:hypothetical protein
MKREIYNPFEASAKTEETMVSESLSIDLPKVRRHNKPSSYWRVCRSS